ncbi:DNA methyltransferase, partial [Candidatus Kuenenbacteria bacterium CG10_big_fil_rev_8_21_14_0_10_36_11]
MEKIFNRKENKFLRKKLRQEMPKGEILLWQRLNNKKMGYKFRRQYSIGSYVVDFYCPQFKLVIE